MLGTDPSNGQAAGNGMYAIYYGSWTSATSVSTMSIIDTFVTNFYRSTWFGTITSYPSSTTSGVYIPQTFANVGKTIVPYSSTFGGTSSKKITNAAIISVIQSLINAGTIIPNQNTLYTFIQSPDMYYYDSSIGSYGPSTIDVSLAKAQAE